jgi:ribosomal protein S18 acetylase RimI-like enzyme
MWLSASVPPVQLTATSSLRCSLQRSSGDPTALRVGDLGVVAEDGPPVGAAWLRLLPEHDRGYGFVDAKTPELSIGVVPTHRGRGIGALLLEALVGSAREQRHEALSLSVEPDNPARRLYERCGFQVVDTVDGSHTMLLSL